MYKLELITTVNTSPKFRRSIKEIFHEGLQIQTMWAGITLLAVVYAITPINLNEVIVGEQVAIIRDVSLSMHGSEAKLKRQLAHLRASRGELPEIVVNGLGISITSDRYNLLNGIRELLKRNPNIDALFAYSDFEVIDRSYWHIDSTGMEYLLRFLKEKQIRLYFSSVRYRPPDPYAFLARETDGRILPNK